MSVVCVFRFGFDVCVWSLLIVAFVGSNHYLGTSKPAMLSRRDDCRRRDSPPRRRELSRRRQKRGRSESMWPGARRIRKSENDTSAQVKILEDKNIGLANIISGLRAALDLKHANIQNYKAKVERLEDRCHCLSDDLSQATSRIAHFEYALKEKQHEENALRESIVVHAKSMLALANLDEKPEIADSDRTNDRSPSEAAPEFARSVAEADASGQQTTIHDAAGLDLEDSRGGKEPTEEKREKSKEPPASPEIHPTEAAPGSPSPLLLPAADPIAFGPH